MNSLTQSKLQLGLIVALPLAPGAIASPARAGPESAVSETKTETVVSETPGETVVSESNAAEVMEPGAVTGALILGLTPTASLSSDAQSIGYLTGGIALGVGMAGFGFSFMRTSEEEYWRDYSEGLAPPKGNNWFAAPAVGRKFAGARIVGQF